MAVGPLGILIARPPAGRTTKPYVLKSPPPWYGNTNKLSPGQLKACIALGEAAMAAHGTKGSVKYKGILITNVAAKVAVTVLRGTGVHGGKSAAERSREYHDKYARPRIEGLKSILAAKGG